MDKKISAIFFDFDGVLVDSTATKTNAYIDLFEPYGPEVISRMVEYHQQNGGISRVDKIDYGHHHFIDEPYSPQKVAEHARRYSELVFEKVVNANWVAGAEKFVLSYYQHYPLFIVSGTPEDELKKIVLRRGIKHMFKESVGAPTRKPEHIRTLVSRYKLEIKDCFFIGDALTDYHAARETGMPFIGIQTEVEFPEGTTVLPDCTDLAGTINRFKNG